MIDLTPIAARFAKPIAVLGLGRSGVSVIAACRAAGIETVAWDDNAEGRRGIEGPVEDLGAADFRRFSALCAAPGIYAHKALDAAAAAGVPVFCDIELFHLAKPAARTVGITGTDGKSTTTALIGHILSACGVPRAVGGNIGTAVLSLPDLPGDAVYVIELSSYQLSLCPTFAPVIAVHTNLAPDHLDRHGGMEGYIAAKARIFRGAGEAVIGLDDEWSRPLAARVRGAGERRVVGISGAKAEGADIAVAGDGALLDRGKPVAALDGCPNLRGIHNRQNAAAAYAACRAVGLDAAAIAAAMQSFPGLAHRQNTVAGIGGVLYINDSKATNDQAASMALRTFAPAYWIAGGRAKEGGYPKCEAYLSHVRRAYLIGEAEGAMAGWLSGRGVDAVRAGTLEAAFAAAHADAQRENQPGATVLLSPACASWDQFKSFEHRGEVFVSLVRAAEKRGAP